LASTVTAAEAAAERSLRDIVRLRPPLMLDQARLSISRSMSIALIVRVVPVESIVDSRTHKVAPELTARYGIAGFLDGLMAPSIAGVETPIESGPGRGFADRYGRFVN
jgi:hypothetical protein